MRFTQGADAGNAVDAAWPVHRGTGSASTAVVLISLEPGMHLATHTDSAEEVLVVLDGDVEAVVGAERGRLRAGGVAVVPALVPHGLVNLGPGTARVAGVFSSNTIVSEFDDAFDQTGGRIVGSPPPVESPIPAATA
jgi:quercetin dioxygenase-like cupin family protein